MVEFNGALYSYVHNLQGDIVGILDNAGSLVVEYKYDAWGKPTLVRTLTTAYEALAELNPFRYRGYVFDEETGLYYLRSRYYNPATDRFVNADSIIVRPFLLKRVALFHYADNNPIAGIDKNGHESQSVYDNRISFWKRVIALGSIVARYSAEFLSRSLEGDGTPLVCNSSNSPDLIRKIRNHKDFKTAFDTARKSIAETGETYVGSFSFELDTSDFASVDLFGALHSVELTVIPIMNSQNEIDMYEIAISDKYDFIIQEVPDEGIKKIAMQLNNEAASDMQRGLLVNYNISISFKIRTTELEE